eukprot:gene15335-biopygen20173
MPNKLLGERDAIWRTLPEEGGQSLHNPLGAVRDHLMVEDHPWCPEPLEPARISEGQNDTARVRSTSGPYPRSFLPAPGRNESGRGSDAGRTRRTVEFTETDAGRTQAAPFLPGVWPRPCVRRAYPGIPLEMHGLRPLQKSLLGRCCYNLGGGG